MTEWENDVGPGWRPLVRAAVQIITREGGVIMQVKEKFGGLRIYFHSRDTTPGVNLNDVADAAELLAWGLCEECGEAGTLRVDLSWLKTLCNEHYEERKKQHGQRQEGTNR